MYQRCILCMIQRDKFCERSDQEQRSNKRCNTCKRDKQNEEDCYYKKGNSSWCEISKKSNHNDNVGYFKNKEEYPYENKQVQGKCFACSSLDIMQSIEI